MPQDFVIDKPPAVTTGAQQASPENANPLIADLQRAKNLQVRTGNLDEVTWETAWNARVPKNLAGQATIGSSDLASYFSEIEQLPPALKAAAEAFSPAANNGYRTDNVKKISPEAFNKLFAYTQRLADATGKPVAAVQSRDYFDVATMFCLQPGETKEDYLQKANELQQATQLALSEDPRQPTVYTTGSIDSKSYEQEGRLPSDVDVVVVVDKADNLDHYNISPLIRTEQYEDPAENPSGTMNKPVQRYLSAATLKKLSEHAERTGVSLHLALFTRSQWDKVADIFPGSPTYKVPAA